MSVALPKCTLRLAFLGAGLLLAVGTSEAANVPAEHTCMGRWTGEGRNTGFPTIWTIDLTLTASPSGGRCGTIEYTKPFCGGTLEGCELVKGNIETKESYSHNDGHCAPAGRVVIRCEGDTMHYTWIGWERVDSILHRVQPAESSSAKPFGGGQVPETKTDPKVPETSSSSAPLEGTEPTKKRTRFGCGS